MDKLEEGKEWLEKARSEYKGFLVEALVHLRTHAAFREVNDRQKALSASSVDPSMTSLAPASPLTPDGDRSKQTESTDSSVIRRAGGLGSWIKSFV